MTLLNAIAALLKILAGLFSAQEKSATQADGAAKQREHDLRNENDKIAKSDRARDNVRNGGGLPTDDDPFNRDNR